MMFCNYVWNFAAIFDPKYAVIWSGVIGAVVASGISYFGVRSANKSSLDRLRAQLEHDAREGREQRQHDAAQNNEDRKAAIRREVYVDAVNQVIKLLGHIGTLPQQDLVKTNAFTAMQPFLQASAKLWLVADTRAAHLARQLNSLFNELFFKALPKARAIRQISVPLAEVASELEHAKGELRRIENAMSLAMEARSGNEALIALQNSHARQNDRIQELRKRQQAFGDQVQPLFVDYVKFMQEETLPAQESLVRTVSALRAELHLEPDEELFMEQLREQQLRVKVTLEALMDEVGIPRNARAI